MCRQYILPLNKIWLDGYIAVTLKIFRQFARTTRLATNTHAGNKRNFLPRTTTVLETRWNQRRFHSFFYGHDSPTTHNSFIAIHRYGVFGWHGIPIRFHPLLVTTPHWRRYSNWFRRNSHSHGSKGIGFHTEHWAFNLIHLHFEEVTESHLQSEDLLIVTGRTTWGSLQIQRG